MKSTVKKSLLVASVSGLLLSGIGLVSAQQSGTNSTDNPIVAQGNRPMGHGFAGRGGPGLLGAGLEHFALGTTVDVSFYDADPANGGNLLTTVSLTVGQDSETAFRDAIQQARANASFMVIKTSEQTRTLDLASFNNQQDGRGFGMRGLPLRKLDDGSSLSVTFYDSDPANGGNALKTLSFTAGQDSAIGFADSVAKAAETAAYMTVTLPAQERTIDLTAAPAMLQDGFGPGMRDGMRGPQGQGNFGPGMHGPGHPGWDKSQPDAPDNTAPTAPSDSSSDQS